MKNRDVLQKTLIGLILILTVGICAGLMAAGVVLYLRGTAAVQAQTAESVFTKELAASALIPFRIPLLILAVLLIAAAALRVRYPDPRLLSASIDRKESVGAYRGLQTRSVILLLLAACGLIAAGVFNGGLRDVLYKAINICTECIGLG